MQFTANEELELRYMQALGLKWIAKEHNGNVFAYEVKPRMVAGEECGEWTTDEGEWEFMKLGVYNFLKWEDEPLEIDKLLMENGWDVPLVEPSGTGI